MPLKRRVRDLYPNSDDKEWQCSRLALEEFIKCPTCFEADRGSEGIKQPDGFPFTLNNAVDAGAKESFDKYRGKSPHPLMLAQNINLIPFAHPDFENWRKNTVGIRCKVPDTNIVLYGAVDDIWYDKATNKLSIVDYKATSKKGEVSLDADWQIAYKRQVSIYQYILKKMLETNPEKFPQGCTLSDDAYFVYFNGRIDGDVIADGMRFDTKIIKYERGKDQDFADLLWVEKTVYALDKFIQSDQKPHFNDNCQFCCYALERCKKLGFTINNEQLRRYNVRNNLEKSSGVSLFTLSQSQELEKAAELSSAAAVTNFTNAPVAETSNKRRKCTLKP